MKTVVLVGNPNCGKTALFNALTGGRQKVGNYPGVTVEKKEAQVELLTQEQINLIDLPGTYSLDAQTPDEQITFDVLTGKMIHQKKPDLILSVVDATHMERSLALVLELKHLGIPIILVVNVLDLASARGLKINFAEFSKLLDIPIVSTIATQKIGLEDLKKQISITLKNFKGSTEFKPIAYLPEAISERYAKVDQLLQNVVLAPLKPQKWVYKIDQILLHPFWGSVILVGVLATLFQAIFTWAETPKEWIESALALLSKLIEQFISAGPLLSLINEGIIAGVGSILVFLPQILILYSFIILLEDSGYMARAAFLMDYFMGKVGLHGRAFIPMLSSYACAIPGIMSTRTIENKRDRLTTILVAPLTTCSARLPVYSLLIGAFIPPVHLFGFFNLQGIVLFALYFLGLFFAVLMAFIFKKTLFKNENPAFLLELPTYRWPNVKNLAISLSERATLFIKNAGTIILTLSILIWLLSSYPKPPENYPQSGEPAISYSYAGKFGKLIEPLIQPIGFDWRIGVALVPGFAAREIMVSALATVYAVEENENEEEAHPKLAEILSKEWSLATGLSLLIWYVLACQCLATIAIVKKETNSWKWPAFMLFYMTVLAYSFAFITYQTVSRLT